MSRAQTDTAPRPGRCCTSPDRCCVRFRHTSWAQTEAVPGPDNVLGSARCPSFQQMLSPAQADATLSSTDVCHQRCIKMLKGPWENIIPKSSFPTFNLHLPPPKKAEESMHGVQPTLSRLSQRVTAKELYHPVLPPDSRLPHEGEEGTYGGAMHEAREREYRTSVLSVQWLIVMPRLRN